MYKACKPKTSIHSISRLPPLLLLLVVLVVNLCSLVVSAKPLELDWLNHVERDRVQAGRSGVLPVQSNHTIANFCTNKYIRMLPKKKIDARGQFIDRYSSLLITSASFSGLVWIQNARTKKYLCFNSVGKQKIKHSGDDKCIFEELHNLATSSEDSDTYMYRSYKYGYYLGYNRNGKKLKGHLPTKERKQSCYKFLKSSGKNSHKGTVNAGRNWDFTRYQRPQQHLRRRKKKKVPTATLR